MGIYRLHLCPSDTANVIGVAIAAVDGGDDNTSKITEALSKFTAYTSWGLHPRIVYSGWPKGDALTVLGLRSIDQLARSDSDAFSGTQKTYVQGNGRTLIKEADGGLTAVVFYGTGKAAYIGLHIAPSVSVTQANSQYFTSVLSNFISTSCNQQSEYPDVDGMRPAVILPVVVLTQDIVHENTCLDSTHFYECVGYVSFTGSGTSAVLTGTKWVVYRRDIGIGISMTVPFYKNSRCPISQDGSGTTTGQYQSFMSLVERFEKIQTGGGSETTGTENYNDPNNPKGAAYPAQGYNPDGTPINLFESGATGGIGGNGSFEEWRDDTQASELEGLPSYLGGQDSTPDITSTGILSIYQLSSTQLTQLNAKLWSDAFWQSLQNANLSPLETVIALYKCKIPVESDGTGDIIMGRYDTEMTGTMCKQYKKITLPDIEIKRYYDTWLDQNPHTQLYLYLPYVGLVDINADYYMGRNLRIEYVFDFLSAVCIVKLYTIVDETPTLIETKQGQFGMHIPLTSSRRENIMGSILQTIAAVGATVAGVAMIASGVGAAVGAGTISATTAATTAGGVAAAGAGLSQTANGIQGMSKYSYAIASHIQANSAFMSSNRVYLFRVLPSVQLPEKYNELVGSTAYVTTIVQNLKGLSVVKNLKLDNVSATLEEKTELKQIFLSGVYM